MSCTIKLLNKRYFKIIHLGGDIDSGAEQSGELKEHSRREGIRHSRVIELTYAFSSIDRLFHLRTTHMAAGICWRENRNLPSYRLARRESSVLFACQSCQCSKLCIQISLHSNDKGIQRWQRKLHVLQNSNRISIKKVHTKIKSSIILLFLKLYSAQSLLLIVDKLFSFAPCANELLSRRVFTLFFLFIDKFQFFQFASSTKCR